MAGRATSEVIDLMLAGATAFLAGMTDALGLIRLRDVFVSFMSGNTTSMGLALGDGDLARAGLIAGIVALFVVGATFGALLSQASGSRHAIVIMLAVAAILAVPLLRPSWTVAALVLAMGALNITMDRVGDTGVGLTYVTGALVKVGRGIGLWLAGHRDSRGWLLHMPIWLSLLAGAIVGATLQHRFGTAAYWALPAFAVLLVPLCAVHARVTDRAAKRLGSRDPANRA